VLDLRPDRLRTPRSTAQAWIDSPAVVLLPAEPSSCHSSDLPIRCSRYARPRNPLSSSSQSRSWLSQAPGCFRGVQEFLLIPKNLTPFPKVASFGDGERRPNRNTALLLRSCNTGKNVAWQSW
jgi:hypothetical protein